MAETKILDFDFSDLQGFEVVSTTGLIEDSGYGTIPAYIYNFQVRLRIIEGLNLIHKPHISIEYEKHNGDIATFESVDTYNNGVYHCSYESPIISNYPITILSVIITGLASSYLPFNQDFPMLRMQKVDNVSQQAIAQNRFYGDIQTPSTMGDLGRFIVSLVRYPFEVETDQNADIVLGFSVLKAQAPLVAERKYIFTLFDDVINGFFGDVRDNGNVEISAILPFIGKVSLDSEFINRHIKIVYEVDILANESVCKIIVDDILHEVRDFTIGFNIPYLLKFNDSDIEVSKTLKSELIRNFTDCKMIVSQSERINDKPYKINLVSDLTDFSGFVKFDNFKIDGIPTEKEFEMLKQIVESGFYI